MHNEGQNGRDQVREQSEQEMIEVLNSIKDGEYIRVTWKSDNMAYEVRFCEYRPSDNTVVWIHFEDDGRQETQLTDIAALERTGKSV